MAQEAPVTQKVADTRARTLSSDQAKAIALLTAGETQDEVARLVGITRKTLWVWGKQPEFAEAHEAVKACRVRELEASLGELQSNAIARLGLLLGSDNEQVAFGSAKYILDRIGGAPKQEVGVSGGSGAAAARAWLAGLATKEGE